MLRAIMSEQFWTVSSARTEMRSSRYRTLSCASASLIIVISTATSINSASIINSIIIIIIINIMISMMNGI